jgi:hypothetical protein
MALELELGWRRASPLPNTQSGHGSRISGSGVNRVSDAHARARRHVLRQVSIFRFRSEVQSELSHLTHEPSLELPGLGIRRNWFLEATARSVEAVDPIAGDWDS